MSFDLYSSCYAAVCTMKEGTLSVLSTLCPLGLKSIHSHLATTMNFSRWRPLALDHNMQTSRFVSASAPPANEA